MRTLIASILSFGLLTGAATPALAQSTSSKSQEVKSVSGTVKSTAKDGFVVTGKEGDKEREYAFSIDGKTTVRKGNQPGSLSDLQPGDRVTVNFSGRDGKAFAQTVVVARP
jgi:hypothetical protein